MIENQYVPGKRLRVRFRDGSIREIPASDSLPEGAELLAVHVPLYLRDFSRDSSRDPSESERAAQRERDFLQGERDGAYLAMKREYSTAWMSEEQRAASGQKIASENITREHVAEAYEAMKNDIGSSWMKKG